MTKRAKDTLIAIAALAIAALSIYFAFVRPSDKIDLDTYSALGAVAAEETAKLLGGQGRVHVMARGAGDASNPSVEAELKAFRDTLKRTSLALTIEKVEVTPVQMMATGGAVPPDALLRALETHPGLGALVLFLGFPRLTQSEEEALLKSGVRLVVVSALQPGDDLLLERQVIDLAIVPRPESPPEGAAPPKTVRERFDQDYAILTPGGGPR